MRPVDRGPWPVDGQGERKSFHPYNEAKADLLERLGGYCSYCECTGHLHIEHVVPKSRQLDLTEDWNNFLLACPNCNSIKLNRNCSRNGYLWPDCDDTLSAFEYQPEGRVRVHPDLPDADRGKAEKLFELVGLGRRPRDNPRASDLRWIRRRRAWGKALFARERVQEASEIDWVILLAEETGFWSVWMTVFADNPEVSARLQSSFPGTRQV